MRADFAGLGILPIFSQTRHKQSVVGTAWQLVVQLRKLTNPRSHTTSDAMQDIAGVGGRGKGDRLA